MKAQRFLVLALGATLSSSAAATAQTSPTGRTITELSAGDYVWPKFSPSGRLLAVSQVLADSAGENTQILILDMRRGVLDTLLSAKAAAKYATYKAYVRDFQWLSDTSLLAWIPDGDVGVTAVTFNVRTRSILHEEHHAGVDDDVWLYRLDRRQAVRVLRQPEPASADLRGGFVAGQDVIFAVGSDTLTLYRLRSGRLRALTRIPAHPQQSGLALRARRPGDVLFIVTVHPPYERGHNPAFWYHGERLLALADYAELADFDVHLPTRRIAFVYWHGEQRHLAVKELLTK